MISAISAVLPTITGHIIVISINAYFLHMKIIVIHQHHYSLHNFKTCKSYWNENFSVNFNSIMTTAQVPLICRSVQQVIIYNYVKYFHCTHISQFYLHIVNKISADAAFYHKRLHIPHLYKVMQQMAVILWMMNFSYLMFQCEKLFKT